MDDDRHCCIIRGMFFSDEQARRVAGKPIKSLVTLPQLDRHPITNKMMMSAKPSDPEGGELGIEIELAVAV